MLNKEHIKHSLTQFYSNPLRVILTLLGIIFGVASFVAMVAMGEGAKEEISKMIEAMGANVTRITVKDVPEESLQEIVKNSSGLSVSDSIGITQLVDDEVIVGYRSKLHVGVTDLGIDARSIEVFGFSTNLNQIENLPLSQGRSFLPFDHQGSKRVCVIGANIAREAFEDNPLGQHIRIRESYFEIIGVLADQQEMSGEFSYNRSAYNDAIIIPHETLTAELESPKAYNEIEMISVQVATTEDTLKIKEKIAPYLLRAHGGITDFDITAPEEILKQKESTQDLLNLVFISISAISLVVGGIGVMNIMLANIMERISEIGLRRALGAKKADIRNQFIGESMTTCFVGGGLGIILGYCGTFLASFLLDIPVVFSWGAVLVSTILSTLIGLGFGLFPAIKAAKINPIEALHHD